MEIYFDYKKKPSPQGTVVTLGNFDGFHLGHQQIVAKTLAVAGNLGLSALVVTFHPHPKQLLSGDLAVLTPLHRKIDLLNQAGVDQVLIQTFTREFAAVEPKQFIEDILFTGLNCRHVVVGYDYAFGKAGSGDTRLMESVTSELGIGCDIIKPLTLKGQIISSSVVRNYLAKGKVEAAAKFLGRPFSLGGLVEAGAGRGRDLGFPTANIYPFRAAALPAHGVYMVKVSWDGEEHWGIANIGFHPTFPDNQVSLEVFVLDYHGNLYGKTIDVQFLKKLRAERQFPDAHSLTIQMERDLAQVIALLNSDNVLKLQRI